MDTGTAQIRVLSSRVLIMKILTLNIQQGGGSRAPGIVDWLNEAKSDIVILTEFRPGATGAIFTSGLRKQGLSHFRYTDAARGRNSVLLASRFPITQRSIPTDTDDSHRLVAVEVERISLIGVYFAQKNQKISLFDTLTQKTRELIVQDSLIMGDFNTGKSGEDGGTKPFYAEEKFSQLLDLGWVDAWRSRNPEAVEHSWFSTQGNGFRIDHALASPSLNKRITEAIYDHSVREARLSDHSALSIRIEAE